MTKKYEPHQSSLAGRVVAFLNANPDESLTATDIAIKFDLQSSNGVHTQLQKALAYGLVRRLRNDKSGEYEYSADTVGANTKTDLVKPAQKDTKYVNAAKTRRGMRGHLPVLDIDAIEVDLDVPAPTFNRPGQGSKWDALINKLSRPGSSIAIDHMYNAAIMGAIRQRKKKNPSDKSLWRCGKDAHGNNRIWRMA